MSELIDKQAAIDAMQKLIIADDEEGLMLMEYNQAVTDCIDKVAELPPVKPAEKVGRWILLDKCSNSGYYCSECQKKVVKEGWSDTVKKIKYCPNCGAKMVEPQESEG